MWAPPLQPRAPLAIGDRSTDHPSFFSRLFSFSRATSTNVRCLMMRHSRSRNRTGSTQRSRCCCQSRLVPIEMRRSPVFGVVPPLGMERGPALAGWAVRESGGAAPSALGSRLPGINRTRCIIVFNRISTRPTYRLLMDFWLWMCGFVHATNRLLCLSDSPLMPAASLAQGLFVSCVGNID
jgi:hypothetical protein